MNKKLQFHETFAREKMGVRASDRSFGLVMASFFAIIAGANIFLGYDWQWWFIFSIFLFVISITKPGLLRPFNIIWFKFGLLLHRCLNPVILGLMFYGVIFPIAIFMRIFGKRPLNLNFDSAAASYWIIRNPSESLSDSMKNQF
jgi:saxitoxin biosynthesis operon SxtJ-like protein